MDANTVALTLEARDGVPLSRQQLAAPHNGFSRTQHRQQVHSEGEDAVPQSHDAAQRWPRRVHTRDACKEEKLGVRRGGAVVPQEVPVQLWVHVR